MQKLINNYTRLHGLGRYACLGVAVLEELGRRYKIHNVQKGRVDYLLSSIENHQFTCKSAMVIPHLARGYIASTIIEQQNLSQIKIKPEIILIDSFSDLTDQLFEHKNEKWQFCCNYLDLQHTDEFNAEFENLGLLSPEALKKDYEKALKKIYQKYPNTPIIYLHFPSALETREKFISRANHLLDLVSQFSRLYPNLYSISVDPNIVKKPEAIEPGLENFPYHYNRQTYISFAQKIRAIPALSKYF